LARELVRKAEEVSHGKVMIRREDFLVLCERSYAWGQEQSAAALGLRSEKRLNLTMSCGNCGWTEGRLRCPNCGAHE
jgi:RNase P subunit RPR2